MAIRLIMKNKIFEQKLGYILLHITFTIAVIATLYTYDYIIYYHPEQYQMGYLFVAVGFFLGSVFFLYCFMKTEALIAKQQQKHTRTLDKMYLEPLVLLGGFAMFLLISLMKKITVDAYSLSGLVLTVGTMVLIIDVIFLLVAASVYRRILKGCWKADSLLFLAFRIVENYEKGKNLFELSRKASEQQKIKEALELIADGQLETQLDVRQFRGQEQDMAIAINRIQEGLLEAVEARTREERMKADLVTNVSHDIKTPLTSIINYVELLKRENLENKHAKEYIRILSEKSERLKRLTEDLVEISKISSGNIKLDMQNIDLLELIYQTGGEFNERFEKNNLTIVTKLPDTSVIVRADGSRLYRAMENLYVNAAKYSLENTTVYVELTLESVGAVFTIKNISKEPLNGPNGRYAELTNRFVRGEISRSTEGSGLGLSIAKSLTELMGGKFSIRVDGNLFIAQIIFPITNNR